MQAELVFAASAELGEGPAWSEREQVLYWVDILNGRIYAGCDLLLQLDDYVGCLAPRRSGGLVLALRASVLDWHPEGSRRQIRATLSEPTGNRLNDGKCDPAGRLLVGSMDMAERNASGALYCLEGSLIRRLLEGVRISNGLTWSPDYRTFYYIDTPSRVIQAFDYDLAAGTVTNGRIAVCISDGYGWPDGMTSDVEGNLWVAMWRGAQVLKWDPHTGRLLERVPIPALQPSSCIFGGVHRNELYVTSARKGLSEAELAEYPLSGGLFRVSTRVTGMPTFEFCW